MKEYLPRLKAGTFGKGKVRMSRKSEEVMRFRHCDSERNRLLRRVQEKLTSLTLSANHLPFSLIFLQSSFESITVF